MQQSAGCRAVKWCADICPAPPAADQATHNTQAQAPTSFEQFPTGVALTSYHAALRLYLACLCLCLCLCLPAHQHLQAEAAHTAHDHRPHQHRKLVAVHLRGRPCASAGGKGHWPQRRLQLQQQHAPAAAAGEGFGRSCQQGRRPVPYSGCWGNKASRLLEWRGELSRTF